MTELKSIIDRFIDEDTPVVVNGIGELKVEKTTGKKSGCKIVAMGDDYIEYEVKRIEEKQEDCTVEVIVIPLSHIFSISKGEEKIAAIK